MTLDRLAAQTQCHKTDPTSATKRKPLAPKSKHASDHHGPHKICTTPNEQFVQPRGQSGGSLTIATQPPTADPQVPRRNEAHVGREEGPIVFTSHRRPGLPRTNASTWRSLAEGGSRGKLTTPFGRVLATPPRVTPPPSPHRWPTPAAWPPEL